MAWRWSLTNSARSRPSRVRPDAAFYHQEMSEFILPYEAVRTAASPAAAIAAFVDSTYDQAATLGGWDRAALECPIGALAQVRTL